MATTTPNGFGLLHEIFILDAYIEEPLDQSRMEEITDNFVSDLLKALRMFRLGPLEMYPATDLRAPGWSFIQPITTSHISGHYFEKPGRHPHIRIDVYSCCSVNWKEIVRVVDQHFMMGKWRASFIDRQIDEGNRRYIDITGRSDKVLNERVIEMPAMDRASDPKLVTA